jgi:agmatinase
MISKTLLSLGLAAVAAGHGQHDSQKAMSGPHESLWFNSLPGDGGTQVRWQTQFPRLATNTSQADSVFSGISTFGRLPYKQCLGDPDIQYDIAFLGMIQSLHNGW